MYKSLAFEEFEPEAALDVDAISHLTLRLAQVLAEEVDMLEHMRVSDLARLQEEKLSLVRSLETQKQLFALNPRMLGDMDDEQRDYLAQVIGIFEQVLKENHRRLRVARDVNRAMVEAIKETMQDHATRGIYSMRGLAEINNSAPLSITLNNVV